jgi:hypothetical protein
VHVEAESLGLREDEQLRRAIGGRRAGRAEHRDADVPEGMQVLERRPHSLAVVEQDLAGGGCPIEGITDRYHRQRSGELGPERIGRVHRRDDQAVDLLIAQLRGQHALPVGVAAGVQHQRVVIAFEQRSPRLGDEPLLPEVLERGTKDADQAGPPAGQRASDRVGLVTELAGQLAHPLLGLLGDLDAA